MNTTITWRNHTISLGDDVEYVYRSYIHGMQCTEPNNWIHVTGYDVNESETYYHVWYYVSDINTELDSIDYENYTDIEMI